MLTLRLVCPDGTAVALPEPVSFEINREPGAADDLTVYLPPCSCDFPAASEIELFVDGRIIFTGIIDELKQLEGDFGEAAMIYARSRAALLLDNEAKAADYKNADAHLIAREHIEPFNLDYICDGDGEYTDMSIYKGLSHWQVIKSFCSRCYSSVPYLDEEGRVVLYSRSGEEFLFSNDGAGIKYTDAQINRRYYKLISSVFTKPPQHDGYDIETTNPTAQRLGIIRTRYADGAVSGNLYGERLISDGNSECLQAKITVPDLVRCPLGSMVKIRLGSKTEYGGLKCTKIKQSLGSGGFVTTITATGEIDNAEGR